MRRDYETINVEVRTEEPTDFALYAQCDVGGPDPNGLGLLGYDNTPGQGHREPAPVRPHRGRQRRHPGGRLPRLRRRLHRVAVRLQRPPRRVRRIGPGPTSASIRSSTPSAPTAAATPILAEDLKDDLPLVDGRDCPSSGDRSEQIACAIFVLGNLVGTTVSHEVGHSLGLADPYGPSFHNSGEADDRLMDADRPFGERAELGGEGPSRFCQGEYDYLRGILPSPSVYDVTPRPSCF